MLQTIRIGSRWLGLLAAALLIAAVLRTASTPPRNGFEGLRGPVGKPRTFRPAGDSETSASAQRVRPAQPPQTAPHSDPGPLSPAPPPVKAALAPAAAADAASTGEPQPGPWTKMLAEPPKTWQESAFADFDTRQSLPQVADLRRWFAQAAYHPPVRLQQANTSAGVCGMFAGVMRLRAPFADNTVLRLSLQNFDQLRIHCYAGRGGVTFAHYRKEADRWAAYKTLRLAGAARPQRLALAATDQGRARRTRLQEAGVFDLRYQAGTLALTRGDLVLLAASLPRPPDAVYFDGSAAFNGIEMFRSAPAPLARKVNGAEARAATSVEWTKQLPQGAYVERHPDGSLDLVALNARRAATLTTALPQKGLQQAIVELEDPQLGAGVFLGGADGKPLGVLRLVRNAANGELCLDLKASSLRDFDFGQPAEATVPQVGVRLWVKLLFGCGQLRWWISTDGRNWAEPGFPYRNQPGDVRVLGVTCAADQPMCGVRIKQVRFEPLAAMNGLVPERLLRQAVAAPRARTLGAWLAATLPAQPPNVQRSDWRIACALKSLAAGCPRTLGNQLLEQILEEVEQRSLPRDRHLALLREAALLIDLSGGPTGAERFTVRYQRVGGEGRRGLFSAVRRELLSIPLPAAANGTETPPLAHAEFVRRELLLLLGDGAYPEILDVGRQLRYFRLGTQTPLLAWCEALARKRMPDAGPSLVGQKSSWRPPFIEELDKEAFNLHAELDAALQSDALADAARRILNVAPHQIRGVAPLSPSASAHLVAPSVAIAVAWRQHPKLADAFRQHHGQVAALRMKQAIAAGDFAAVRLAAAQFEGLPVAAEGLRWLGDWCLSRGRFGEARAFYHRASQNSAPESAQRKRLAAALLGRVEGKPTTAAVRFADATLSAESFEQLLRDLRKASPGNAVANPSAAFEPAGLDPVARVAMPGPVGLSPNQEVLRGVNQAQVDWATRQLAVTRMGEVAYIANRFHLSAWRLGEDKPFWQIETPPGRPQRAREWSLTPMRPVVDGTRLYVRMLYGSRPLLSCFDRQTGKRKWSSAGENDEYFVSDAFVSGGALCVLAMTRGSPLESRLRLVQLERTTGEAIRRVDVLRFRPTWWKRRFLAVATLPDGWLAASGGVVFRCDPAGQLLWVRGVDLTPADEDPHWVRQAFQPPLTDGSRVFVTQPGSPVVQCLDAETGLYRWRIVRPSLERIVGLFGPRLVIRTTHGFEAVAAADGKRLWVFRHPQLLEGVAPSADKLLALAVRKRTLDGNSLPELLWIDLESGRRVASAALPALAAIDPRIGHLQVQSQQLWLLAGSGAGDASRQIVRLQPKGPADRAADEAVWTDHVPPAVRAVVAERFPGWEVWRGMTPFPQGIARDAHGRLKVPGFRLHVNAPLVLAQRCKIADGEVLRLSLGDDLNAGWKLDVRQAGRRIHQQVIDADQHPDRWKQLEIPLAPAKEVTWLTLTFTPLAGSFNFYCESITREQAEPAPAPEPAP